MKAFNDFGGKCNGCAEYAEFCHCEIDNDGNLLEVFIFNSPLHEVYSNGIYKKNMTDKGRSK